MALGHLEADEEASVRAHLDGCADCSREAAELASVAAVLPAAEVERVGAPVEPPPGLETRVFDRLRDARLLEKISSRRRLRTRVVSGLAAAAIAVVAVVVANRGTEAPVVPQPSVELVSFTELPPGAEAEAEITETDDGLNVHLRMQGMPEGDWLIAVGRDDGTEEESVTFGAPSGGWSGSRTLPMPREEATKVTIRLVDGTSEFSESLPDTSPARPPNP
jgi:hypothetical protein